MSSQPPESGTAELPGSQLPAADHPLSSQTKRSPKRSTDSRVVVIPSLPGEGVMPGDVLPDERTVISAAKSTPPLAEVPLAMGAKHAAQHLGETLIGRRLEHYELTEFVGGGGMGAVFRANDTRLGRTVAVKVLSRDQSSEENVRRFRNEAQSAARLDHRYIARVHYVGEDAGLNFIVFEFIEGINLRELVQQRGPLPLEEALRYTREVAEALAHASQRDVVHRDIKPSNVLITPDGHVKVVDMGLARLHQVDSSFDDLTASGVTLGTFDYISPEQARDPRAADVRSDIYSLGCTLYFMLSGKPPFPDGSALQKLLRHNGVDPPDVRLFRPELPPAIGPLLAKMLAKRPVQRQQSAEELVAEIERMARDLGYDIGTAGAEVALASPTQQRVWVNWGMTIIAPVVVLGVALVALEYLSPPSLEEKRIQLRPAAANLSSQGPRAPIQIGETPEPNANEITPEQPTPANANSGASPMPVDHPPMVSPGIAELINNSPAPVGPPPDIIASRPASPMAESPALPPKSPAKIIVRKGPANNSETDVVGSLAQAVRRVAAADKEKPITEIELDFDGELLEYPFEVAAKQLTIHPAAGRKPRIIFRPLADATEGRQMIHLLSASARLSIQEVELQLDLPDLPSDPWTMFALHQGQSLDLSSCVVTVVDHFADKSGTGLSVHDQMSVSVVQLQSRRVAEMMKMEDEMAMMASTSLNLEKCLVRGETTLLSMAEEMPVRLQWNEGLFVSSKRLLETGGAKGKSGFQRIELGFNRVTFAAQQGLVQMKRGKESKEATNQMRLEVTSDLSIFSVGSEAPLFEFVGGTSSSDVDFEFSGLDNRYPRKDMIFARVRQSNANEENFTLDNRSRWASTDRSADLGISWQSPPPSTLPRHAQTGDHYRLSEELNHSVGFRPEYLPVPTEPVSKVLKPAVDGAPEAIAPAARPAADASAPPSE